MKRRCTCMLTIAILFSSAVASAQTFQVIAQSGFQPEKKRFKEFSFIESATDTTDIKFVATIKVTGEGKRSDLSILFLNLKTKAQSMGANAFKLKAFERDDSLNRSALILDTYYATDAALALNLKNRSKNIVYIFGNPGKTDKSCSFKVGNEKKELKGGMYYRHENKEGEEVKINKGGFSGASMWIKWEADKPSAFLTLTGFGLGGGPVPAGQIGLSFNTGRINYMDPDLGLLLASVLSPQTE